ncbi:hypothetical protein PsorP6_006093 [Peronosclerospora sorghi]|uniref:Uncharacterized protein n=1 Tax=Peronosclerospora sorghi TaxID=230839 RepID=A0ACC0W2G8_9STRA|nr:hypothetical protein PsorP6_006093 [Peronosclerospora sorghi]
MRYSIICRLLVVAKVIEDLSYQYTEVALVMLDGKTFLSRIQQSDPSLNFRTIDSRRDQISITKDLIRQIRQKAHDRPPSVFGAVEETLFLKRKLDRDMSIAFVQT